MTEPDSHDPLPRRPDLMCAVPFIVAADDTVYCGLERGHGYAHMAIIWFTDSRNDWPEQPAREGSQP